MLAPREAQKKLSKIEQENACTRRSAKKTYLRFKIQLLKVRLKSYERVGFLPNVSQKYIDILYKAIDGDSLDTNILIMSKDKALNLVLFASTVFIILYNTVSYEDVTNFERFFEGLVYFFLINMLNGIIITERASKNNKTLT